MEPETKKDSADESEKQISAPFTSAATGWQSTTSVDSSRSDGSTVRSRYQATNSKEIVVFLHCLG
jgi:hypothetical protein